MELYEDFTEISKFWTFCPTKYFKNLHMPLLCYMSSYACDEEFSTIAAVNLCLPPPYLVSHGDNVQSTNIPSEPFHKRRDFIKMTLYNLCKWAGLPVKTEVYNLLSRLILQDVLTRFKLNIQRQLIISDLGIVFPVGRESKSVLAEIKLVSISQTRYWPTWEERGVERRAGQQHQKYVLK